MIVLFCCLLNIKLKSFSNNNNLSLLFLIISSKLFISISNLLYSSYVIIVLLVLDDFIIFNDNIKSLKSSSLLYNNFISDNILSFFNVGFFIFNGLFDIH